jgi:hypothetical protein
MYVSPQSRLVKFLFVKLLSSGVVDYLRVASRFFVISIIKPIVTVADAELGYIFTVMWTALN